MIGKTFYDECTTAGVTNFSFAVIEDTLHFSDDYPADQRAIVEAALAAHVFDALGEAKAAKVSEAAAACDAALASYAARFGVLERLTWETQLKEALAILPDPEPNIKKYPLIGGIIAETGEAFGAFAMAVVANSEAWTRVSASAIGQRQALAAQVKAVTAASDSDEDIAAAVAQVQAITINIAAASA